MALVSRWPLNEAAGTTADDEVGSNDGDYVGAPALDQAGIVPAYPNDGAVDFDGSSQYVEIDNGASLQFTSGFRLKAWFDWDGSTEGYLLSKGSDDYYLYVFADGSVNVGFKNSGGTRRGVSSTAGTLDSAGIYCVEATYDQTDLIAYVDGAEVASDEYSDAVRTSSGPLRIATFGGAAPDLYQPGRFARVEVSDATVDAATILAEHTADTTPPPPAGELDPAPQVAIDYGDDPWAAALRRSHEVVAKAWLLDGDTETELATVTDGSANLDSRAATRGRCDVTLVDDGTLGLVPNLPSDPLAPYGREIRLARGVRLPDGTELLSSLGVFRLEDVDVDDTGDQLEIKIAGMDRSVWVIDAKFEEPYQIAAGTNYADAIRDTLLAGYPAIEFGEWAVTSLTTPVLIAEEGSDRWEFCQKMAAACGMELFFDGDGKATLRPVSQIVTGNPVWHIVEGENGVLIRAARRWTRQGSFNRAIVTGENISEDGPPARGVATDDNSLSPTYYNGPFGRVPRFEHSEFVTSDAQAVDVAAALLARELGTTERIDFGTVVNPRLKPGDVIRVDRERAGILQEDHVIDTLAIPLRAEVEMSGTTRATVVI